MLPHIVHLGLVDLHQAIDWPGLVYQLLPLGVWNENITLNHNICDTNFHFFTIHPPTGTLKASEFSTTNFYKCFKLKPVKGFSHLQITGLLI